MKVMEQPQAPVTNPRGGGAPIVVLLVLAQGAAFLFLVLGGSPPWAAIRMIAVLIVATSVAWVSSTTTFAVRGWIAVILGVAGTAAGLGIGVWHLIHGSLTLTSVAGLVALVTGFTLLAWGATILVIRIRGLLRLWALPAGMLMLIFVLYPATSSVMAVNVPPSPVGASSPAMLGMAYEDVTLQTDDGVRLSAWYVPATNGAAVVMLHGAGSNRSSMLRHAAVLARHGYGTLLLDSRGHGRSGGVAMDWGWHGDSEIDAAVSYLLRREDVTANVVGLVGLSMGGEEAIGALAHDARIGAVVAEGVTGRSYADHGWLPKPAGWANIATEYVMFWVADLLSSAPRPTPLPTAVAKADVPMLLIVAEKDQDEQLAARYLQRESRGAQGGSRSDVEVWVVAGSGHTGGLIAKPEQWESRVVAFLDSRLDR